MTNKYPDLQREMMAREQGVQVFLRQPFSARWIDQALARLEDDTVPGQEARQAAFKLQAVRMPMRVKITLPYLLLALFFALASAYLISRVVLESIQDRFLNQLIETGQQSQDWMVRRKTACSRRCAWSPTPGRRRSDPGRRRRKHCACWCCRWQPTPRKRKSSCWIGRAVSLLTLTPYPGWRRRGLPIHPRQ